MPSSILNSDDGVISGTSGLKSSGGDDGALAVQSNGTEVAKFKTTELVINDGGDNYDFRVEGDTDANLLFVDASTERVGVRTNSPELTFSVAGNIGMRGTTDHRLTLNSQGTVGTNNSNWIRAATTNVLYNAAGGTHSWEISGTERMRINSSGDLLVGKTAADNTSAGVRFEGGGSIGFCSLVRDAAPLLLLNRLTNDGTLQEFAQAGTIEGTISVSGSTVSYNGGNLSRWAQLTTPKDDTPLFKGTVMSNLDEMNVYVKPTLYWTEDDELPVDEEGNPTVAVGDLKQETSVSDNEQLNKVKVSDVEGDANVAGVFVNWTYDEAHQVDEINMAMTGDMIIRIAGGVPVARGDLLMSAGDGTAKPQGDDIVRSKTIAKVTSTHVTCTYDDGSYCVPCVLMAC
jgi:hypothetical protein